MADSNTTNQLEEASNEHGTEAVEIKKRRKSNGCFKWVVLAGSFLINFIMVGSCNAFGVIYTDLLDHFGESRSKVSWIGSLYSALPLIGGVAASMLVNKIGCRAGSMVGSLIAAGAVVASSFVTSLDLMYLTYGCVAGLANSVPFIASVLIISEYFDNRLGLANGIAESGNSVGTLVLPIAFEKLSALFGWRGNILFLGGILLNMVVFSALFRANRTKKRGDVRKLEPHEEDLREMDNKSRVTCQRSEDTIAENGDGMSTGTESSLEGRSRELGQGGHIFLEDMRKRQRVHRHSHVRTKPRNADTKQQCTKGCSNLQCLSIFRNKHYLAYLAINCVYHLWVNVPYVYLSDRAIGLGIGREQAALQLSVIGGLELVGNIFFGFIGDLERVDNVVCFGVCVFLAGVALAIVPFFTTFGPLAAAAGMFGFFSAASESMCSVMLVEFLSVQRLSSGYGYVMVFKGVTELIGPPIAGLLYDASQSYDNTFFVAGGSLVGAGLIYTVVAKFLLIKDREKVKNESSKGRAEVEQHMHHHQ